MPEQQAEQQLDVSRQHALDAAYEHNKRSMAAAYVLAVFFGMLGLHRLYLGRKLSGCLMLGIWLAGFLLLVVVAVLFHDLAEGFIGDMIASMMMLFVWAWVVVDLFLIPMMLHKSNAALAARLREEIQSGNQI